MVSAVIDDALALRVHVRRAGRVVAFIGCDRAGRDKDQAVPGMRVFVAFLSDRDGRMDVWVTRSEEGSSIT